MLHELIAVHLAVRAPNLDCTDSNQLRMHSPIRHPSDTNNALISLVCCALIDQCTKTAPLLLYGPITRRNHLHGVFMKSRARASAVCERRPA